MIKAILSDFSETILFPKDVKHHHNLNGLHRSLLAEFGNYNAWDYFVINQELLNFFKELKQTHLLYLFTSDAVQNQSQIKTKLLEVFIEIISAKEIGINKQVPEAYLYIAKKIGLKPSEILFIDDRFANLIPAKQAGFEILQYTDNNTLIKDIKAFIV